MTASTTFEQAAPTAKELTVFLARYSASLFGAGATCARLEKNIARIAAAYGKKVEAAIMPAHIHISVWNNDGTDPVTAISAVARGGVSFQLNTALSRLSWKIADGKTDFADAVGEFDEIIQPASQRLLPVLLAVALANASFCRLFGGDTVAMAVVFVATAAGYCLKDALLSVGTDLRITLALCAFVSSVLGATDALFSIGCTPMTALGTSVLYLVPGIPFLNSFSDLLYKHYLCAFSRFADAVVLTGCLSAGLCAGLFLLNFGMF